MTVGTLYFSPNTRSVRVYWLILELKIDVEIKEVNLNRGENRNPEYLKINPAGKVPSFVDNDVSLFETSAICLYLLDKYDQNFKFGGSPGSPQRANLYKWISYVSSSVDDVVIPIYLHKVLFPPRIRNHKIVEDNSEKFIEELGPVLLTGIKGKRFFGGNEFSAVDVVVGYILGLAYDAELLETFPELKDYVERLKLLPNFKKSHSN